MSEQSGFDFSKNNDPELAAITYGFTNEQYHYYSWLNMNVSDNAQILSFSHESSVRLNKLSSKFAVTANNIRQYYQNDEMASELIGTLWYDDEIQRTDAFKDLSNGVSFDPLNKDDIDFSVSNLMYQYNLDPDMFILQIREEYKESIKCDVEKLLMNIHMFQEAAFLEKIPKLPLSTPDSVHLGYSARYFKQEQNRIAIKILSQIIETDSLKF